MCSIFIYYYIKLHPQQNTMLQCLQQCITYYYCVYKNYSTEKWQLWVEKLNDSQSTLSRLNSKFRPYLIYVCACVCVCAGVCHFMCVLPWLQNPVLADGKDRQTNYSVYLIVFGRLHGSIIYFSCGCIKNINASHILWHIKRLQMIRQNHTFWVDFSFRKKEKRPERNLLSRSQTMGSSGNHIVWES